MTTVLFAATEKDWQEYHEVLPAAFARAGVDAEIVHPADQPDPDGIDYIVYAPSGGLRDFTPFRNLKAVQSLWAGVESILPNDSLTVPLARMVEDGLREGMVEWCVGHTLRHHLGMDQDICRTDTTWAPHVPPLARHRRVTVLGLGALGLAVAEALSALNFDVAGWSRTAKSVPGLVTFHGNDGLETALGRSDILILLLPLTAETRDLMSERQFALMPEGAFVINPGRGPLIDDDALIAALDRGHIAHATLDVFRTEPLPPDHPFWAHPSVTVTPHIAADTRAATAAEVVAENIRRAEAGAPLLHLVDRSVGY